MARPFTLNIYALRIIPNTTMAKDFEERRLKIPPIDKNYFVNYARTIGNCLVFALTFWKMPKWLYKILRKKAYPVQTKQKHYPILFWLCRTLYLIKREFDHIRFMDFSYIPGNLGYYFWKFGVIRFWQRYILKQYHLPKKIKN